MGQSPIEDDSMRTELYWVEGPWPGHLAIAPRPRGGDWLDDEIRLWRRAGVDVVLSLLTPDEIADLNLTNEEELSGADGLDFISFPVGDRSVPSSTQAVLALVTKLVEKLADGKSIAIHCRQGIGRAALIAICLLVFSGVKAGEAVQRVSTGAWVRRFQKLQNNGSGSRRLAAL